MNRVEHDVDRLQSYNPFRLIEQDELDEVIGKFVTLIWIIKDKRLTKTTFFVEIVENDVLREIFKNVCGCDTDIELYKELLSRHPSVCESKFVKNKIKKINLK